MLARTNSLTLTGIEGHICEVEVHISGTEGEAKMLIVGLPDAAIKESNERVKSAIKNSGYMFPFDKVTVNLAPADLRKEGPAFDLAIAVCVLAANGSAGCDNLKREIMVGELALDGRVRPVNGVLSMAMSAREAGFKRMIVPLENAAEAAVVQDIDICAVSSLTEAVGVLSGALPAEPVYTDVNALFEQQSRYPIDYVDVKGQESVKRALMIAAAGGHNVLMMGPPGSGKTMLSKRLATILPELSLEESLETTRIYSSVGLLDRNQGLIATRPFRNPHHSASGPALIGGSTHPKPGELSLAHHGILFLDEFPEFSRSVLETIRQPLEDGCVTIARAQATVTFPANFMLVASANPCPCGYYGSTQKKCRCSPGQVEKYLSKLSGPLLDRIDIQIEVPAVEYRKLRDKRPGSSSSEMKEQVQQARERQRARFAGDGRRTNSDMTHREVEKFCVLDEVSEMMLKQAMVEMSLSARAHDKICKLARTIADLAASETIAPAHIGEAICYRRLDMLS